MTVSGVIFFLASQRALEASFGVFLVGFVALLLAFFAVSFLVDQVDRAEVRWFKHRYSFAWFWSAVLVASLSLALGIFLVLPKRFGDPVQGAQGVVLPIRADDDAVLPEPLGDAGPLASALPVSPQDGRAGGEAAASDEGSQPAVAASPSPGTAVQEADAAGDIQATVGPSGGTKGAGAMAPSAGRGVEVGPDKGVSAA